MAERNLVAYAKGGEGIDAIELREEPVPSPGPGEALVRLTAATLNFRDLIIVRGMIPGLTGDGEVVPTSCGCGEVIELGDGVAGLAVGERVSPLFALGWLDIADETAVGGGSGGPAPTGRPRVILPPGVSPSRKNLQIVTIAALLAIHLDDELM